MPSMLTNNPGIMVKKRGVGGVIEAGEQAPGEVKVKGVIAPFQLCRLVALTLGIIITGEEADLGWWLGLYLFSVKTG